MKQQKKSSFYKNPWFWIALFLVLYILRDSKVVPIKLLFDVIVYIYKQIISQPIAFLAFLLSIVAINIERINVIKNDRRAPLSISYKIEGKSEVKASFAGEVKEIMLPRLRIYENSGTIKSSYLLTPYIKDHNLLKDTLDAEYFSFNAIHIHLNEKTNSFKPDRLHHENYISLGSFISNNPRENQSHFTFLLVEGIDGTYKLLLLVYSKNELGNYYLEVIDRVDALNKKAVNRQHYYDQFKKCEKYLKGNNINIT